MSEGNLRVSRHCVAAFLLILAACDAPLPGAHLPGKPQELHAEIATGTVYVLCYHSFQGRKTDYDVAASDFDRQMKEIRDLGFRFVRTEDVLAGKVNGDLNVWLTIDDGNESVQDVYDRTLKKLGIKPLLFIYPAIIGRVPYALKYNQLENFVRDGSSIGAHGFYHLFLNEKQFKKDKKEFMKEIYESGEVLENKLGVDVELFAYPFGVYSDLARDEIHKAGYRYAFTIEQGSVRLPLHKNAEPLKLPRYLVTKTSWKNVRAVLAKAAQAN